MQAQQGSAIWPSWRSWIIACTVGWLVGFVAGFVLAASFDPVVGIGPVQSVLGYLWLGTSLGFGVSLMQWRVLRRRCPGSGWWVIAGTIGMGLAGGIVYGVVVLIFGYSEGLEGLGSAAAVVGWMVVAAFGGAMSGALQWRILRRDTGRAGWWLLASTLGWALSFGVNGTIMVAGYPFSAEPGPLPGITLGIITRAALPLMLEQSVSEARTDYKIFLMLI